jgi:hypothetical protein
MTQERFNPKLSAIVSIRNLVKGISTEWKELRTFGKEIDQLTQELGATFINNAPIIAHQHWVSEQEKFQKSVASLKENLNQVIGKINAKQATGLTTIWEEQNQHSNNVRTNIKTMIELGKVHLPKNLLENWATKSNKVLSKLGDIQQLADGSHTQLQMIEEYAPEEVDELTDTILKHMPMSYSMDEAKKYEKEYMLAYEDLKTQASQKKNLWDKFLDVLAGGTQQTPAQMVMMKRWVDGEKVN